jgi:hypothetical protein
MPKAWKKVNRERERERDNKRHKHRGTEVIFVNTSDLHNIEN